MTPTGDPVAELVELLALDSDPDAAPAYDKARTDDYVSEFDVYVVVELDVAAGRTARVKGLFSSPEDAEEWADGHLSTRFDVLPLDLVTTLRVDAARTRVLPVVEAWRSALWDVGDGGS